MPYTDMRILYSICLYWVFDIVFCPKAQETFDLICHLVGLRSGVKATPLVRIAQLQQILPVVNWNGHY